MSSASNTWSICILGRSHSVGSSRMERRCDTIAAKTLGVTSKKMRPCLSRESEPSHRPEKSALRSALSANARQTATGSRCRSLERRTGVLGREQQRAALDGKRLTPNIELQNVVLAGAYAHHRPSVRRRATSFRTARPGPSWGIVGLPSMTTVTGGADTDWQARLQSADTPTKRADTAVCYGCYL